jgi:hypothetical protein
MSDPLGYDGSILVEQIHDTLQCRCGYSSTGQMEMRVHLLLCTGYVLPFRVKEFRVEWPPPNFGVQPARVFINGEQLGNTLSQKVMEALRHKRISPAYDRCTALERILTDLIPVYGFPGK